MFSPSYENRGFCSTVQTLGQIKSNCDRISYWKKTIKKHPSISSAKEQQTRQNMGKLRLKMPETTVNSKSRGATALFMLIQAAICS